jgi:hypothetical protein
MSDLKSPCAYPCDQYNGYTLPDVGNIVVGICTQDKAGDPGTSASCIPGDDFTCKFQSGIPGGGTATFTSTSDTSMFGLGSQIATLCGGTI